MYRFYPIIDSGMDAVDFYKLAHDKQIFVKSYNLMCFTNGMSARRFKRLMNMFPTRPVHTETHKKISPYNSKQHIATWTLDSPIPVGNEDALNRLCLDIEKLMDKVLGSRVSDFEFDVRLVAYRKDDAAMIHPYYLEKVPFWHNIWEAQEATFTIKIDSFLGTSIRDLPEELHYVWLKNIREGVLALRPTPEVIREWDDHIEVTWKLTEDDDLGSTLDWIFFDLGANISKRDKYKTKMETPY